MARIEDCQFRWRNDGVGAAGCAVMHLGRTGRGIEGSRFPLGIHEPRHASMSQPHSRRRSRQRRPRRGARGCPDRPRRCSPGTRRTHRGRTRRCRTHRGRTRRTHGGRTRRGRPRRTYRVRTRLTHGGRTRRTHRRRTHEGERPVKIRKGLRVERPISTPEALQVLEVLAKKRAIREDVSQHVNNHAAREGWNPDLRWSGVHNLRHGLAAKIFREGVQRTRDAGSWLGPDVEQRYWRKGRIGPRGKRYGPTTTWSRSH